MSQLFSSEYQNNAALASASVLPVITQGLSFLRLIGLISLLSKGLSRVLSNTTVHSINFLILCLFTDKLLQPYVTTEKTMALTLVAEWSLRFQHTVYVCHNFLRSNYLLIPHCHQHLEPNKRKSIITSTHSPSFCQEIMGPVAIT